MAYSDLVLAEAPFYYLRLGETSGGTAVDSSGNNRNGVYFRDAAGTTAASLLADDANPALGFPSTLTYLNAGLVVPYSPSAASSWTVVCILKPTAALKESVGSVFQLGQNGYGVPELTVVDQGNGTFKLRLTTSGVAVIYLSTSSWAFGTTLHVKLSRNPTDDNTVMRVNGVQEGTASVYYDAHTVLTNIGHYNGGAADDYPYSGTIDEFATWDRFVSDAATDAMYAAMSAATPGAAQVLDGIAQAATGKVIAKAVAARTLANITRSATGKVLAKNAAAQTLAGVTQTATATVTSSAASVVGSQTTASPTNAAAATIAAKAAAGTTLGGVVQAATATTTAAARVASAAQTLAGVVATATVAALDSITADQALAGVGQTAAATVANTVYRVTGSQVLADVVQLARLRHEYIFERTARTLNIGGVLRELTVGAASRSIGISAADRHINIAPAIRRLEVE